MKKVICCLLICSSFLYAETLKTTRVKGKDIVTGGDYLDGQYISQDSAPKESGYVKGFYISDLITQELYEKVTGKNPSAVKNPKAPVTNVNLEDIIFFCEKLSELEYPDSTFGYSGSWDLKLKVYRLPLEEEWELALQSNAIKPTNILERTLSLKNTQTMRFGLSEEKHKMEFPKYCNYVFRGNNSSVKRDFHNAEYNSNTSGFRVVRPDMTEWGFPEQKTVPAGAKADTTIENAKTFVEKAIQNTKSDEDGLIHINMKIAEVLDATSNTEKSIDKLTRAMQNFKNVRINLDLKDCVFKVPDSLYDIKYMSEVGFWRFNQLESVIVPDSCDNFGFIECDNLKYVQTNTGDKISLNTFDECSSLKYVFVPRQRMEGDEVPDVTLNTGVQTQIIWNTTAEEYKKNNEDFYKPVERIPDPTDCKVTFNHKALYYGSTFDVEIEIPQDQVKKQVACIIFVYQKDRDFELYYKEFKINGKTNKYILKNINTREFDWPENDDDDEIFVCPIIEFEDGTCREFYETKILIVG